MGTTSRYLAASRLLVACATIAFSACKDRDHTDICIGPRCPPRGPFDHLLGGSGGEAGSGGVDAGTGGTSSDLDGGPDDQPDATPLTDGGNTDEPCSVAFLAPAGADGGQLNLGGADDVDGTACGAEFTISVSIASNAGTINLFVNDSPLGEQSVLSPTTDVDVILGNRGSTPNTLRVQAEMPNGDTCEATFPADILVDCDGPSCTITHPIPSPQDFLNASHDEAPLVADFQSEVVVQSELDNAGETVRLEVDGAFVPDEVLSADGANAEATFDTLTLDEAVHSVQAECRDAEGNVTLSPATLWTVDITPCTLTIDQIAGGADPVTPANDGDPDTDAIEVVLTATITGDDCQSVRVGECGESPTAIAIADLGGQGPTYSVPVTLPNATATYNVCATVVDEATNTSPEVSRSVNVRIDPPALEIDSPDAQTQFNRLGGNGALGDNDTGTPNCETSVTVLCTETNVNVTLLIDGAESGTELCQSGGGGSFAGAATFDVSLPSKNDGSLTTISATQQVPGFPAATAPSISVQADCEVPACSITAPDTSLTTLNSLADSAPGTLGFQISFVVESDANSVGENARITVDTDPGTPLTEIFDGDGEAVFADVSLDEGLRSIEAECFDAAGNVTAVTETWTVDTTACTSSLVVESGADPITTLHDRDGVLANLQVLGAGTAAGDGCVSARVGVCDAISASFTALDQDAAFLLPLTLPSVDGAVSACVEIVDDAGNIGTSPFVLNVRVTPPEVDIEAPSNGAIFTPASTDCDTNTAGLQIEVSGISDAVNGSNVAVTLGSATTANAPVTNGEWTACVPTLDGDDQTLTALVTDAVTSLTGSDTITVSVDTTPSGSIAAPTFTVTARRLGEGDLQWLSVLDADGDPLDAYQLRCATTAITDETTWNAATDIDVSSIAPADEVGETETISLTGIRTGTSRFCVVRGEDDNGNLSAMSAGLSGVVANPFLEQPYVTIDAPNNATAFSRVSVEPLGDINGDGIDDFAQGATNRGASIFFGDPGIDSVGTEAADITLTLTGAATSGYGSEIAGLGDVSGDGIADFALGAPGVTGAPMVFVFFGRSSNTWPASIAVDANGGNGCEASLCILGSALTGSTSGLFGWDVHSVDFDGVAPNDLVIGARFASSNLGQVFILLGGANLTDAGPNITITNTNLNLNPVRGYIATGNTATALGFSVGSAGNNLTNVIIGANAGTAAVFVLPALGVPVGTGLTDVTASLQTIETGASGNFGVALRSVGDYNGDTFADFAAGKDFSDGGIATLYLGSSNGTFSSTSTLQFLNDIGFEDGYGSYIAAGSRLGLDEEADPGADADDDGDPIVRVLGDLDNDGLPEFLVGSAAPTQPGSPAGSRGSAQLFYGAAGATARTRTTADFTHTATVANGQVVPNFVGDINGDGFNDIALLDGAINVVTPASETADPDDVMVLLY